MQVAGPSGTNREMKWRMQVQGFYRQAAVELLGVNSASGELAPTYCVSAAVKPLIPWHMLLAAWPVGWPARRL